MKNPKIFELTEMLLRIIDSTSFFFNTRPDERIDFKRRRDLDMKLLPKLGYVTFVRRFQANAVSIHTLLSTATYSTWVSYEHSIGIINRSNLLHCLYVLAWEKDKELIKPLLADSFSNLAKSKIWKFNQKEKQYLTDWAAKFNSTQISDLRPSKLIDIAGIRSEVIYQIYDLYSKYDHFSVSSTLIFPLDLEGELDLIQHSVSAVIESLKVLYNMFEKDLTRRTLLIKKLSTKSRF